MIRILIVILMSFTLAANAQTLPAPYRLRCDFLLHTEKISQGGITKNITLESAIQQGNKYQFPAIYGDRPVFNWEVASSIKQVKAWRILVSSSSRLLDKNEGDYWDSNKIVSTDTRAVYKGKQLKPGKLYYWKVAVWNNSDKVTPYSNNGIFYLSSNDSLDDISHYPLSAEMRVATEIIKTNNGSWFLDFGKDAFAQLYLHLSSPADDSIWIVAGEAVTGEHHIEKIGRNIAYIKAGLFVKKGTHDYTIAWPVNEKRNSRNPILMPEYIGEVFPFRYVAIENFKGEIDKNSVRRKTISYPFENSSSSFISSDTVLNQVWELCKYSVKATSFTGYYIDGDRERLPYEADALINQLSHYAVDPEYSMARRSMAYVLFHPTWPTEWSLQNVLLAWNDYLYTGDNSFIKKYYTELQKKILMPLAGSNGLISTRTNKQTKQFLESIHITKDFDGKHGLKDNVDWPQTGNYIGNEKEHGGETDGFVYNDYNSVVNAFYYHDLVLMEKIALVLYKTNDATFYRQKAQQVYQSFQRIFRNAKTGLIKDGDSTDHSSLHANMFALAFGLVAKNDIEKVTAFIKTRKMACSVYGAQFLLDALYDNHQDDYALSLLNTTTQRSWYNMIRSGSTITMEAWDKLYKPNLDWNHAWGAAPANIIVRKLMGVEPLSPGFDTFQIKPQIGGLTFAELKTPTIKGEIFVSYKKSDTQNVMDVIIPGGAVATIYVPYDFSKPNLFIDAKMNPTKPKKGFIIIKNVSAGRHEFIMK